MIAPDRRTIADLSQKHRRTIAGVIAETSLCDRPKTRTIPGETPTPLAGASRRCESNGRTYGRTNEELTHLSRSLSLRNAPEKNPTQKVDQTMPREPRCTIYGHDPYPARTCPACRTEYLTTNTWPTGTSHQEARHAPEPLPDDYQDAKTRAAGDHQ